MAIFFLLLLVLFYLAIPAGIIALSVYLFTVGTKAAVFASGFVAALFILYIVLMIKAHTFKENF